MTGNYERILPIDLLSMKCYRLKENDTRGKLGTSEIKRNKMVNIKVYIKGHILDLSFKSISVYMEREGGSEGI